MKSLKKRPIVYIRVSYLTVSLWNKCVFFAVLSDENLLIYIDICTLLTWIKKCTPKLYFGNSGTSNPRINSFSTI